MHVQQEFSIVIDTRFDLVRTTFPCKCGSTISIKTKGEMAYEMLLTNHSCKKCNANYVIYEDDKFQIKCKENEHRTIQR
jgi:hypothetical protein